MTAGRSIFKGRMEMDSSISAERPLCPLRSVGQAEPVPCVGTLCAWWDRLTDFCSVFTAAEALRFVGEQINAQNFILGEMEKEGPCQRNQH